MWIGKNILDLDYVYLLLTLYYFSIEKFSGEISIPIEFVFNFLILRFFFMWRSELLELYFSTHT